MVDDRELWEELESKQKFTDWANVGLLKIPIFEENVDYVLLQGSLKQVGRL